MLKHRSGAGIEGVKLHVHMLNLRRLILPSFVRISALKGT